MTLSEVASDLFLFLVTFRRQVRKGLTPDARQVRAQLLEIFDEMGRKVRDDAKLAKLYEKARYTLVITADEILINSNWAYSQQWEDEILEYEFFKTRIAGEKFFMMVEDLQDNEEELAEIFYLCLCLGFVGRYKEDAEELRRLKRRLYRMVPGRINDEEKRVTPDAYFVGEGIVDIRQPLVNLGRIAIICGVLLVALWIGFIYYKHSLSQSIVVYAAEMRKAISPGNIGSAAGGAAAAPVVGGVVPTNAVVPAAATPVVTATPASIFPGAAAPAATAVVATPPPVVATATPSPTPAPTPVPTPTPAPTPAQSIFGGPVITPTAR